MVLGELEIRLRADIARLQRDMDSARRVVNDTASGISRAADVMKAALASIGIGAGIAEIIRMSDEYTKFTAQLRLAATSQREYAASYADVKRIATSAQQSLSATGTLYARIANGTRELGTTQKQVAEITETVNLALRVSGATATESASAQLQLSQAFASGTLRGEEFNAVNEAAPRLMKALADGMGLPIGALKAMAGEGQITSKIMADVLPGALEKLREESKQVSTIGGAFTVLKNELMEFTATKAEANGTVMALTTGIRLLSENLGLLMGVLSTLGAAKIGEWMVAWATKTYQQIVANRALATSTLSLAVTSTEAAAVTAAAKLVEAQANVRATASAVALADARVVELRAAVLASEGVVALAIATNGLIPAQARATALAEAHAIALRSQAVAAGTAATTTLAAGAALTAQAAAGTIAVRVMGLLRGAMAFFGGPVGLVITLLGAAAMAWSHFGNKAKEESAKAAVAVTESTSEMIARLDEQIAKLKERNRLQGVQAKIPLADMDKLSEADRDGLARARDDIEAATNGTGRFEGRSLAKRQLAIKNLTEFYEAALARVKEVREEAAAIEARSYNQKYAQWQGENGTADQKRAYELEKLREKFGKLTEQQIAYVNAKYADKGAATAIKQEETAYKTLMVSIGEKIKANKLDLDGFEKLTASQKMTIKLDEAIANGKANLTPEHIKEARALIDIAAGQEAVLTARNLDVETAKRSAASNADNLDVLSKTTIQLRDEALAQQEQNDRMGLSAIAIADLDAKRLEHLATIKEENAALAEQIDWSGGMTAAYLAQAQALREKAAATRVGAEKGNSIDVTKAKELLDIMSAIDDATKSAANGMAASFGRVGSAIGGLTTAISGYGRTQAAIAAQLAAATKDAGGDRSKIERANAQATQQSAQAQVRSYGDMAGAAKSFFKENSTGYKVMEGTEKAFRAAEMAMAIQAMVKKIFFKQGEVAANLTLNGTKLAGEAATTAASTGLAATESTAWGITAVVKALASLPFPANLAAGAATLAAVVAIGAKLVGGISGGSAGGGMSAADAQKNQGTGGVFGDSTAKTDSIKRSLEMLEQSSGSLIPINRGMLSSLRSIEASMKGLTNLLVRAPGVIDGSNMGIATGQLNIGKATDAISGVMTQVTKALFGPGLGDKIAGFINNLWGKTKQSIVDSGIQFGGSVNDLQSGKGYSQYASVDTTKSSFFGLSKKTTNSIQTQGLNDELSAQFGLIFTGLEGALTAAAVGLGVGADHVKSTLDALTIDVTSISLKGLSGTALTEALNATLSKAMDQMSAAVFPELDAFRQIGEGYTEAVVRLASNYAKVDGVLSSLGMTFGTVGIGSLAARERLISLSGGIDKLTEQAAGFASNFLTEAERLVPVQKYVTEELGRMGLAGIATRDQFKEVVLGLNVSTEAGAETYASLMALQEAFAAVVPAIEATGAAAKSASEILDERKNLQQQYDELAMTSTQLLDKQRNALDESNRSLFDQVQAQIKSNAVSDERKTLQQEFDTLTMTSTQLLARQRDALDGSNQALFDNIQAVKSQKTAAEAQKASIESAKTVATGLVKGVDDAFAVLQRVTSAEKDRVTAAHSLAMSNLQEQIDAEKAADSLRKTQVSAAISNAKALSDAIRGTIDSMRTVGTEAQDRASAQAAVIAALAIARAGGGLPSADSLKGSLSTLAQDSTDLFATMQDYQRDFYRTQNSLKELGALSDSALSIEEKTLKELEEQKDILGDQKDILEQAYKAEVSRLDNILASAQSQIDALKGIDVSNLTIVQALQALNLTLAAAKANPVAAAAEPINEAYKTALGRAPDAAGMEYWQNAVAGGQSTSTVVSQITNSKEAQIRALYKDLLGREADNAGLIYFLNSGSTMDDIGRNLRDSDEYQKKIKGYAGGGDHMGGLRVVGELGPELEWTGPSRITNSQDFMRRMSGPANSSNGRLEALVEGLTSEVQRLQAVVAEGNTSTRQMADQIDNATDGGNAFRVDLVSNSGSVVT